MTAAIHNDNLGETKSHTSYKSTHSSRSSVLERAREYTRKMEGDAARRAKSLERQADEDRSMPSPRSQSAGRGVHSNSITPRGARASVEKENNYNRPKPMTPASTARTGTSTQLQGRTAKSPGARSMTRRQTTGENGEAQQEAVVSPELLVDALSGHEDGLLAIAERLMEHYDSGYDAMGEAIIDAFADVQKLFQHVVEAAHMEGAAFEASRREEELKDKRQSGQHLPFDDDRTQSSVPQSPSGGPVRHDEFIDQDVKDCLADAIRNGAPFKESGKHLECYEMYEQACQSASSLLPVDSDHRGRLQLSIARAESMAPDRGCAILRYAMDDVMRSGLRARKIPLPDPSKRADVVLSKPKVHPSMNGNARSGVVQSSEEALASLVEEMKEIMNAPVYKDTPLQDVARRFWAALGEAQKQQARNEERLEHNLGELKGEYLLARAEWEEKLNLAQEQADSYKNRYLGLKDAGSIMQDARALSQRLSSNAASGTQEEMSFQASSQGLPPSFSRSRGVESVASLGSGLAQQARTLVGNFACAVPNERSQGVVATELAEGRQDSDWRNNNNSGASKGKPRSFREFSPRGVDV
eukprot:CAMPEP_0117001472 /NCGR_PEP_ID=MMETSP0472-20121206/3464_1 /TAXON_ID=693140 ORGANISM="Tiarina fusus, Strain LIS" /NCGR_SAMPLE_ID=MMETSP0472 /ASSEMBLY_ACC=CAM_ASM_000603 /LENGTH=584 /DNA_ID=CAMNT_0004701499 /DNA_START=190 /DNA_END=1944 /DNA_ORIENTATION=-